MNEDKLSLIGKLAIAQQLIDELLKDIIADNVDYYSDRVYSIYAPLQDAERYYNRLGNECN